MKHVIIGNGVAGLTAAETIRRMDPDSELTLISDETFLPYCRPMISHLLEGAVPAEKLPIRGKNVYAQNRIEPVLGARATTLDVDRRVVTTADGKTHAYDRLLLACGADPRQIDAQGRDLENIFFMRTVQQVRQMLAVLPEVGHALVLGGGLVGFKAAYSLLRRGIAVTMLIRSGYPLSMQVDETAGRMIQAVLQANGLTVRTGASVEAFEGNGRVRMAHLSDGTRVSCDMAVIGKGVFPAHGFVPADRIHTDAGILVDDNMQTSVSGVYAAGDIAEHMDIARQRSWVNAIWPEAVSQGRVAGMNMAGEIVSYRGSLSRNVIRVFDTDVMTAGRVSPRDIDETCRQFSARDLRRNIYRKLVFSDNILVGFAMINDIEQGGALTALIQSRRPVEVEPERLMEPGFNIGRLMAR
ncbi:MAG: NAD(P)/FAD-dependent oxidoreductase [Desulfobacterales bacterium]|nr:NAD(P)/FAD-dependent oxidoreductase [Desulfobacterales bacterium]MBS3756139.1 NAD(P)/FAD-dependent oxidoreductase [Desulfobacterales bacterium]